MAGTNGNSINPFLDEEKKEGQQATEPVVPVTQPTTDIYTPIEEADPYAKGKEILNNLLSGYKVETPEQKAARERREKSRAAVNGIADMGRALANLYFTTQYAPNAYNEQQSLSAKGRERMALAKAERDKERDAMLNYALNLGKIGEGEQGLRLRIAQARQGQKNWQNQYDLNKENLERDKAYKDWTISHTIEREKVQDEKDDAEQKRRQRNDDRSFSLQVKSLAADADKNTVKVYLGGNNGFVDVPKQSLSNPQNTAALKKNLPKEFVDNLDKRRVPIKGKDEDGFDITVGYERISDDDILTAVGSYLESEDEYSTGNRENIRNILRGLAGNKKSTSKGTGY